LKLPWQRMPVLRMEIVSDDVKGFVVLRAVGW
jgi:hypothetical protein